MTINDLFSLIIPQLAEKVGDLMAPSYARWLLEESASRNHYSLSKKDTALPTVIVAQLSAWTQEIVYHHKPLDYIIGSIDFSDIRLKISPPTLIPRPETEEWCTAVCTRLRTVAYQEQLTIVDIGTGSGCIAASFAHALPNATIYALDVAASALSLAQQNCESFTNVTVVESSYLDNLDHRIKPDIILSNPPYLSHHEWQMCDKSVHNWEDYHALVSHDNGMGHIKKIIIESWNRLTHNPLLFAHSIPSIVIEIGYLQGEQVSLFMKDQGFVSVKVEKDLAGKDRIVSGCMPPVNRF